MGIQSYNRFYAGGVGGIKRNSDRMLQYQLTKNTEPDYLTVENASLLAKE